MRCDECFDCPKDMVEQANGISVCPCCGATNLGLPLVYRTGFPALPPGIPDDDYERACEIAGALGLPMSWLTESIILPGFAEAIKKINEIAEEIKAHDPKAEDRRRSKADIQNKRKENRKRRHTKPRENRR